MSYSFTTTESFTLTHARRLAAKVAADMHQCELKYPGHITETEIDEYQQELTVLLQGSYVKRYEFGFKTSDNKRIVTWQYEVGASGDLEGERSGGLYATANISGGSMFNFLSYSDEWFALESNEKDKISASHPVSRNSGHSPQDGNGYWDASRSYASGGVAVTRKEFRPWAT